MSLVATSSDPLPFDMTPRFGRSKNQRAMSEA
jgi:hypothetical protein